VLADEGRRDEALEVLAELGQTDDEAGQKAFRRLKAWLAA
jgi:hypothetical protein